MTVLHDANRQLWELSALYEIATLGEKDDPWHLVEEVQEKALRLLGVTQFALALESEGERLVVSWGGIAVGSVSDFEKLGENYFCFEFTRNGIKGFLVLGKGRPLSMSERRLFTVFARHLEMGLQGALNFLYALRYQEGLKRAFLGIAEALVKVVEQRDPYTSGHSVGVAKISEAIGKKMGFSEEEVMGIYVAGILHDVGKVSVPIEILVKPGALNELEMGFIRMHPQAGYEILKGIAFPWPVAEVALQHHERLDGSGYPRGLKGEEICKEARIIAIADVVDAMTHARPYRPPLGIEKALEEIIEGKGRRYDPEVVEAFMECVTEGLSWL